MRIHSTTRLGGVSDPEYQDSETPAPTMILWSGSYPQSPDARLSDPFPARQEAKIPPILDMNSRVAHRDVGMGLIPFPRQSEDSYA